MAYIVEDVTILARSDHTAHDRDEYIRGTAHVGRLRLRWVGYVLRRDDG